VTQGALLVGALALSVVACSVEEPVTIQGVITAVDGDLTSVRTFDVRTVDGETIRLVPAPFGDFSFPPPHLINHMQTLDPVTVTYVTTEDGVNLADSIADAELSDDG
jgi:hypothetical protein